VFYFQNTSPFEKGGFHPSPRWGEGGDEGGFNIPLFIKEGQGEIFLNPPPRA